MPAEKTASKRHARARMLSHNPVGFSFKEGYVTVPSAPFPQRVARCFQPRPITRPPTAQDFQVVRCIGMKLNTDCDRASRNPSMVPKVTAGGPCEEDSRILFPNSVYAYADRGFGSRVPESVRDVCALDCRNWIWRPQVKFIYLGGQRESAAVFSMEHVSLRTERDPSVLAA